LRSTQRACRAIESMPVCDRAEIAKMPQFHRLALSLV
jgi:hypothetical protein